MFSPKKKKNSESAIPVGGGERNLDFPLKKKKRLSVIAQVSQAEKLNGLNLD